jgi:DNA-binding NarL/FixJ family response regulator
VASLDSACGRLQVPELGAPLAGWSAMARARWTLVDHFDEDGKRYLLAVREAAGDGLSVLSPRERQVVGFVAQGRSNKSVAYELGISQSTVSVLVCRASARLGVRSRRELIAKAREACDANRAPPMR